MENNVENVEKVICPICGKELDEFETLVEIANGDEMCEDCLQEKVDNGELSYCDDCGEYYESDRTTWLEGLDKLVCEDCLDNYYKCEECGEWMEDGDQFTNDNGDVFCESCYNDRYTTCYDCECEIENDYANYDEDGYPYCDECYSHHNCNGLLRSYHTTKDNDDYSFYKTEKDKERPLYFGFELEVDTNNGDRDETLEGVDDILNRNQRLVTFEEDGSLSCDGFEIIGQPMTLDYIRGKEAQFTEAFKYLMENQYTSHDNSTCGLHIHFSRDYFDENKQKDLEDKLTLISEVFQKELELFCRRGSNGYAHFINDRYGKDNCKKLSNIKGMSKGNDRYQVFNFTNRHTIEFRLAKGTLIYNTFMATIELVNNMIHFASKKDADLIGLTWEELVSYNKTNNKELLKYCEKRHLIKTHTIVNFGAIDTIKADKKIMDKVLSKLENKGAYIDITLGEGAILVQDYMNEAEGI